MRSFISIIPIVLIALLCSSNEPAQATIITVEVSGLVDSLETGGDFALDGSVNLGSGMTGYCSYDSETPDIDPSEDGGYALLSISMTIGSYTFTHDPMSPDPAHFGVTTIDPSYSAGSNSPLFDGTIYVDGSQKTYEDITWDYTYFGLFHIFSYSSITNDALPDLDSWPDFSAFDGPKQFGTRFYEPYAVARGSFEISGEVTSLTVVPEPATIILLGFGGVALLRKRKV